MRDQPTRCEQPYLGHRLGLSVGLIRSSAKQSLLVDPGEGVCCVSPRDLHAYKLIYLMHNLSPPWLLSSPCPITAGHLRGVPDSSGASGLRQTSTPPCPLPPFTARPLLVATPAVAGTSSPRLSQDNHHGALLSLFALCRGPG